MTGAAVTGLTGSGADYVVTVATGTGSGTVGLTLPATGAVTDAVGNALAAGATGPAYTVDRYEYLKGQQDFFRPDERIMWHDPTYPQLPMPPDTLPNVGPPAPSPVIAPPAPSPVTPPPAAPKP